MPNRVDPTVNLVQPPDIKPMANRPAPETDIDQLRS
jgi:hypothetical protein